LFWLLMLTVAVQDHLRDHTGELWKPVLWEGSSFIAASALLGAMWRHTTYHGDLLARPWRWFGLHLRWLPLLGARQIDIVSGTGHYIHRDRPDAVLAAVGQVTASIRR
jgi:hypothetical protein